MGRVVVVHVFLFLLCFLAVSNISLAQPPNPVDWGRQTADTVERFLPQVISGLTDRFPWDRQDFNRVYTGGNPRVGSGCGPTGCTEYEQVDVTRTWRITDFEKVKEYEALTKREEGWLNRLEELRRKASQQEMMKIMTEIEQIGNIKRKIQFGCRDIEVRIRVNMTAQDRQGIIAKPVGTIKGYPFYHKPDYNGVDVRFAVYLGPQGFKNPRVPEEQKPRTEVKCILVEVQLHSNAASIKNDETLARQMLEKVDYAGLAKLLER